MPMDPASFRIPVEIWAKILSYLIYPPLTPNANALDHIENAKLGERERRNLRLVCKSWNAFADDEIRLVDISWTTRHLEDETSMLLHYARRARVLSCHEDMIWGPTAEEILQRLDALAHEHTRMSVLSIEVCMLQFTPTTAEDILANYKSGFSNLTHLRLITHLGYVPENGHPCNVAISLHKLQVLEYHHSTPRSVEFLNWSLPSLQRLSIGYLSLPDDLQAILKTLTLDGLNARRLRSLTLVHPAMPIIGPRPSRTIPPSLWASCPALEEFTADLEKIIVHGGPPTHAALARVTTTQEGTGAMAFGDMLQFAREFQRTWPSVRKAKFTAIRWRALLSVYSTQVPFANNDPCDSWDRSLELIDAEGLDLFEEYKEVVKYILSSSNFVDNAYRSP